MPCNAVGRQRLHLSVWILAAVAVSSAWSQDAVTLEEGKHSLRIGIGDRQIAEYVYADETILRPYFRDLRTRSGVPVTRNLPPIKGQDLDDHPTMHPGLWLAFGDLSGADFWRNKGRVRQTRLVREPQGSAGEAAFVVSNRYEGPAGPICAEQSRIGIQFLPSGYMLHWKSTFSADQDFAFGDQEEMGLGVRVATPLAVAQGGEILDSEGRKNGAEVWGKQADWCVYCGIINGQRIGVALMPAKKNFRPSWFHARDYGLLVANPFGRNAFTKGEKSRVIVKKGNEFDLGFHVLICESPADNSLDIAGIYREYVRK